VNQLGILTIGAIKLNNNIGLFLKNLQKGKGENVDEMVRKLNVSRSFYFAVCNGRKKCPDKWFELIPNIYKLDEEKSKEWIGAIALSNQKLDFIYEKLSKDDKNLVFTLVNFVDTLSKVQKEAIWGIINNSPSLMLKKYL